LTEIPEHLLRRSRERRAALGLSGGGDDQEALPSGAAGEGEAPTESPGRARAASTEVATTGVAAPPAIVDEAPPETLPTYVAPPRGPHKTRIPLWVMPVLIALPVWAFLFPGAFGSHIKATTTNPIVLGNQVYHSSGCSGCHGANGEGGVGPALHAGQSVLTFPNVQDQINWIKTGSVAFTGKMYGNPNRPGGQRGPSKGDMPGFASTLSETQIEAVVTYERTAL
jgi:mono/diheme cytochrome c family protein